MLVHDSIQDRHPATKHLISLFTYDHVQDEKLRDLLREICDLAHLMYHQIPDSPELTTGLRKLLEAQDCFVRAALVGGRQDSA